MLEYRLAVDEDEIDDYEEGANVDEDLGDYDMDDDDGGR